MSGKASRAAGKAKAPNTEKKGPVQDHRIHTGHHPPPLPNPESTHRHWLNIHAKELTLGSHPPEHLPLRVKGIP